MDIKFIYYILYFIIIISYLKYVYDINNQTIPIKIIIPKFTPRTINPPINNPYNIPLTIYQSWHSNVVSINMASNIHRNLTNNPEFDYYLYDDNDCREFIKNNYDESVVNAFDSLIPGAYKSDLWRYCILYINGGIYFDLKFYTVTPLSSILHYGPTLFVKDRFLSYMRPKAKYNLYNAFMISTPKNPIFKYCIYDIVNSCKFKLYKKNPLDITGPGLLGHIIIKYFPNKYYDYTKFIHNEGGIVKVINDNIIIFAEYPEYRYDQKLFQKTKRYDELWTNRKIYN
jgi:mannosyltransferase OCH1-like enzyme